MEIVMILVGGAALLYILEVYTKILKDFVKWLEKKTEQIGKANTQLEEYSDQIRAIEKASVPQSTVVGGWDPETHIPHDLHPTTNTKYAEGGGV